MRKTDVRVVVLVAAGTNCDRETIRAFRRAGASPERLHVRELIEDPSRLERYHIVAIPGGFSYGDDLGAGRIFGNEIRFLIGDSFRRFVENGGLILGICNGFQVLVRAGLLPGLGSGQQEVTLAENDSGRFECRWTHLEVCGSNSVFLPENHRSLFLPVAHAEGKFVPGDSCRADEDAGPSEDAIRELRKRDQVVLRYLDPDGGQASYPWNPNGSVSDVAAISDSSGRILGMMPHPERFYEKVQHPAWQRTDVSDTPDGLQLIRNGVEAARRQGH